jgi:hypothetical protein
MAEKNKEETPKVIKQEEEISLEKLKAMGYDTIGKIEYYQNLLRNINNKIAELSKK